MLDIGHKLGTATLVCGITATAQGQSIDEVDQASDLGVIDVVEVDTNKVFHGQETVTAPAEPDAPADTPVNSGRITLSMGVTWTSEYFFRGYLQEDDGLILQPYAEVGFKLLEAEDDNDISLLGSLGTWNSFHSEHTASTGDGVESWYESDFYGGLTLGWKEWSLDLAYIFYTYPSNDDFETVQEISLGVTYNLPDDHWSGKVFGNPSVTVAIETDNSNVDQENAAYLQLGFGPSMSLFDGKATLSIPVAVGLSLDDYYVGEDDETFGFASIGADVAVPLGSGAFGTWTVNGGVNFMLLGDTTQAVNHGDDSDLYGYVGLGFTY